MTMSDIGLLVILALVLSLPFLVKKIEEELELFLLVMGCAAVTLTAQWNFPLIKEALVEPIKITLAVFFAGIVFQKLQKSLTGGVNTLAQAVGIKVFVFFLIVGLGLLSSIMTAIIASLFLVEIISSLKMERTAEIKLVVLTCFAVGLGAALTPIGEPLSTIAIAKLQGQPYHADFFFLARQLGWYIVPGIFGLGLVGFAITPKENQRGQGLREDKAENLKDILFRTGKVYVFVMALIFLGSGFKPLIDDFVTKIPYQGLYWLSMISAVLDNATLTAAEIGPSLHLAQIKAALLGLLISGGMLIPGNIPNIISAEKLKISSSEWAKFGVPFGLIMMTIYCFFVK
jgi:predicted cation transporter